MEQRVFFSEPGRSNFDLNFRLFAVPIRVHPSFWLFSAFFGWHWLDSGWEYLLLWIGCTFVSILLHEMGHVFMALCFGRPSHVVLYAMGGLAIGDFQVGGRWRRIAIFAAGPGAGLLLYFLIWGLVQFVLDRGALVQQPALMRCIEMLLWMNLLWNVLNLMPIWPLDGGQIAREICSGVFPGNGIRISLGVSFLVAGVAAFYSIIVANQPQLWYPSMDPRFAALFFGLMAINSFLLLQQAQRVRRDDGWERDPDVWGQ